MENKSLKEKAIEKINRLKSQAEQLNLQLHLGVKEAKESFEDQKKEIVKWADSAKKQLEGMKELGNEKMTELKTLLEELQVQAALGKAETQEAFEKQQKIISQKIQELKTGIGKANKSASEKAKEFSENFEEKVDGFQERFDLFRLQFHLGKAEAKELWEQKKKDLDEELQSLDKKLEKAKSEAGEYWDNFEDEITKSWKHLKNAFKK
jgi:hypothetical protein